MNRRTFLATATAGVAAAKKAGDQPPGKVIVGTVMQPFWEQHPGLPKRLQQLTGLVDQLAEQAAKKYGRGLDLAVLPEAAVTGEVGDDALARSALWAGEVQEAFARQARQHRCYIVAPTYLLEPENRQAYNVALLFGRKGELAGVYRKVHLAVSTGRDSLEGGTTPGKDTPVFQCDFGKLGLQICFDIEFDKGWEDLARQGAELIAWPTQSPQTAHPAARAMQHRYYIVSSTWRNNASIFEPTGKIVASIRPPESVLVQELDLSYVILPWSPRLQKGELLRKHYSDRVGFRYYEDEDCGLFWSNDPKLPIRQMVRSLGLADADELLAHARQLYRKAGVPGYGAR
jgi:predicted amidohydrolase